MVPRPQGGGHSRYIIHPIQFHGFRSESILAEYKDVLQRPKFKFPPDDQEYIISAIKGFGKPVIPVPSLITLPDTKDLPFYETAKAFPNCYLITGNKKHFPDDSFIVNAREMLDILATC